MEKVRLVVGCLGLCFGFLVLFAFGPLPRTRFSPPAELFRYGEKSETNRTYAAGRGAAPATPVSSHLRRGRGYYFRFFFPQTFLLLPFTLGLDRIFATSSFLVFFLHLLFQFGIVNLQLTSSVMLPPSGVRQ